MRAFRIVGVLVVLAMVLSACGAAAPAAAPTAAPAAAAPAAATTTAPAAAAPAGGELKIAVLAPLSGPVPTFGVMTRDGALLAIEEWNAKGGVLGMKIVPIVEDSQCTPDPAVNAANKVIDQDKVHYIVGEVCSKASIPISEIANAKGVLQISPTSTNPDVTVAGGKVKDYIFRACFIDPFQGLVGAKFAINELKAKSAFIMLDQANDYVKGLAEVFEKEFAAAGGKIVGKESYTAQDTDFSAILAKVADAKPDVVYLPDYYNIVNLAAKQAKEKGITAPFLGGDGWDSSDLDLEAAAGGYFTNHYSKDSTAPAAVAFQKNFAAKYKDDSGKGAVPYALAALAYDATNILLASIQAAGVDDASKVKDAMAAGKFEGVSGTVTYDANHNPVKSATILAVSKDGVKYHSTVAP